MKKTIIFFFLNIFIFNLFPQTVSDNESQNKGKDVLISMGEAFSVNVLFNLVDKYAYGKEYADVDFYSFKDNLTAKWWWDIDDFATNQIGHPYQGSLYFNAGRSNGLSFSESFLIAAFGSLTWEEFGETDDPSINDIITTPYGGAIFGEVMHRLFLEAHPKYPVLSYLISPMDGFSYFARKRIYTEDAHIEEMSVSSHGGYENGQIKFADDSKDTTSSLSGGLGLNIIYGEQYGHDSKKAYDSFILDVNADISSEGYRVAFSSDGYLFSRGIYIGESNGTIGINLLYDGMYDSDVPYSDAAAGIKYMTSIEAGKNTEIKFSVLSDGIFMGARGFFPIYEKRSLQGDYDSPPRFYNLGYGCLVKSELEIELYKKARFIINQRASYMTEYHGSKVNDSDYSHSLMLGGKAAFEYKIKPSLSVGLYDDFLYMKNFMDHENNSNHYINTAGIYLKLFFI